MPACRMSSVTAVAGERDSEQRALRVFLADAAGDNWTELTAGHGRVQRLTAPDLQRAQRARAGLNNDVAAILDLAVFVADDFRSAREHFRKDPDLLRYAGTLNGLAGLVSDIFVAGVADGVTLIPAVAGVDVRAAAQTVLARLSSRLPVAA